MDNNKNKILTLIAIITIVLTLIGATYAFFAAQAGGTTSTNATVTSNTTDLLTFSMNRDISFTVTQSDFQENGTNKSGDATATATLTPNNKTGAATMNYYLYLNLQSNPTLYSGSNTNEDPELMLQVFDGNNQLVTLTGLGTQKTIKGVTGYDITGVTGLKTLLDNHAISASNNTATIENWKVVITLINLDVNQNDNTGKTISAEIIIRQDEIDETDLTLNVANLSENGCNQPTINCNGVTAVWNNKINQLEISSLDDMGSCNLACQNPNNTTPLNSYIIGLNNTTQGEGQVVSENGYRYEGAHPNNYVMFNNELWRILGVFSTEYDSDNDGTTDATANLVKIIKKDEIGGLAWDKSESNDWPNSSLYHLLNEQYYDWNTNKATVSTYCYGYSTTVPAKCDYSIDGIQDGYRNMIVKAKWYLGGGGKTGYTTYTPDSVYSYERDANAIYSGRSASTPGYIGLMYESDYLYGVLASDCARTTAHESYNSASCAGKDWLYGKGLEWTISPNSDNSSKAWYLSSYGYVRSYNASSGYGIRPVLYLSSSVYKVSGTGTITDPYIIGM